MTNAHAEAFEALVQERVAGRPVAHLLGHQEFWSLPLKVSASTLIPRPDTECLVEVALLCRYHRKPVCWIWEQGRAPLPWLSPVSTPGWQNICL